MYRLGRGVGATGLVFASTRLRTPPFSWAEPLHILTVLAAVPTWMYSGDGLV